MAWGDANQFVTSAARTTSADSGSIACEKSLNLNVLVEVTAASGTSPNLAFFVDWSPDGVNWYTADPTGESFTAITAAPTRLIKQFPVKAPFFRLRWTISGTTPSFTFDAWKYFTE